MYRENYPNVKYLANIFAKIFPSEKNHVYSNPLDDQWVILSSSKAFYHFRTQRDEIRCLFDPP